MIEALITNGACNIQWGFCRNEWVLRVSAIIVYDQRGFPVTSGDCLATNGACSYP